MPVKTKVIVDEAEIHCYIGAGFWAITTSALMTLNWIALVVLMTGGCVCSESLSHRHAAAPRLFCDICDMFDLHETEDCPQQAMSSDSPPPSHHGGSRDTVRPYCDTCESELCLSVRFIFYEWLLIVVLFFICMSCIFFCDGQFWACIIQMYSVSKKKSPPLGDLTLFIFFTNG